MNRIPLHAYAEAYVAAATAHEPVAELEAIRAAFRAAPELAAFVADPSVPNADRMQAIRVAADNASEEAANFIILIASHRLLPRLDRIIDFVREEVSRRDGTSHVSVTSAVPLTDKERKRIATLLGQKTKMHVILTERIDPSIGGGLLIRIGDWEFDATVKGKIERLQQMLTV